MEQDFDLASYKDLYISEARESISQISELLLSLEKTPNDENIIREIYRLMHSLKGSSATMGYSSVEHLAHETENLLSLMRDGKLEVTSDLIDLLLSVTDSLNDMINQIAEGMDPSAPSELIEDLKKITSKQNSKPMKKSKKNTGSKSKRNNQSDGKNDEAPQLPQELLNIPSIEKERVKELASCGYVLAHVNAVFSNEEGTLPFLKAMSLIRQLAENNCEIIKTFPDTSELMEGKIDNKFDLLVAVPHLEEVEGTLKEFSGLSSFNIHQVPFSLIGIEAGKEVPATPRKPHKFEEMEQLIRSIEDEVRSKASATFTISQARDRAIGKLNEIKVKVQVIDNLFNLTGELVLLKSRLAELSKVYGAKDLADAVQVFERLISSIHEEVMQVRLVPLAQVFNIFPRMVRDLSRELGRKVDLLVEGGEVAVDRQVLEEVVDALIHLVRNAIDHGIEPPEERLQKGKPEIGTVKVSARKEGNSVVLEVEDDGRGVDPKEVVQKALERGFISESMAKQLNDDEALSLLFLPGFSTKNSPTTVSGRGVGLDSVKAKVESLGGSIELWSRPNEGTKVRLRLPLSMAIIRALIIQVEDEAYAIPASNIVRILQMEECDFKKISGHDVLVFEDQVIPVKFMAELLGNNGFKVEDQKYLVVVEKGDGYLGLVVTDILLQDDIVVKPLTGVLRKHPLFSGATILGDGRVCLILDISSLKA